MKSGHRLIVRYKSVIHNSPTKSRLRINRSEHLAIVRNKLPVQFGDVNLTFYWILLPIHLNIVPRKYSGMGVNRFICASIGYMKTNIKLSKHWS